MHLQTVFTIVTTITFDSSLNECASDMMQKFESESEHVECRQKIIEKKRHTVKKGNLHCVIHITCFYFRISTYNHTNAILSNQQRAGNRCCILVARIAN